jgi:hypothetical protein
VPTKLMGSRAVPSYIELVLVMCSDCNVNSTVDKQQELEYCAPAWFPVNEVTEK